MSKGNKIPVTAPKKIGIPEIDDFFPKAFDPLDTLAGMNNMLDDILCSLKGLAADIRRSSGSKDAPKEVGVAKIEVDDNGLISVKVMDKDDPTKELTKLPKGTQERVKMVSKKAKMLQSKRLAALRKQGEAYAKATFVLDSEDPLKVKLDCDTSEIEDKDVVQDLKRSLAKFNDRVEVLKGNLKGIPTLSEALQAILNDIKKFFEEKAEAFKAVIEGGMPKIDIPDSILDAFPNLLKKAWETLQKLIDFLKKLVADLPEIKPKIETAIEEAKSMPGKVKELASNLPEPPGPKKLFSMVKATKDNLSKVASAPDVLATVSKTLKETTTSLVESVESATGKKGE